MSVKVQLIFQVSALEWCPRTVQPKQLWATEAESDSNKLEVRAKWNELYRVFLCVEIAVTHSYIEKNAYQ